MTELTNAKRPEFRNIHAFKDLTTYRLPAPGIVSILHRISGALMFVLLPLVLWIFDNSVSSEVSFAKLRHAFDAGASGIVLKLLALALLWAYLHHFIAGVRHVWMDLSHHAVTLPRGRASAKFTLWASVLLTLVLGAKLFGLY
ncbi:MAG TPA: succinate dehydrogenase, cytochrome b556 subunit [Ramlibacter sp.]|nr:succinate dehydrogenase, cytochrome b556 subunit [Ramlibacter sp.]